MTLLEARTFLQRLKDETSNASEIKMYEKFIYILSALESREFSKEDLQSLGKELDGLQLESNPENRKKHFTKALRTFEKYVKDTFSLISKGYYTNRGIGLGASFGLLFGIVVLQGFERSLGIALGLSFGMLFGLLIGRSMDAKAIREGNVL